MSKKLIALMMAALMLLSVAAACGNDKPAETPTTPTTPAPTTPAPTTPAPTQPTEPAKKIYYTYLTGDVDTMNGMGTVLDANSVPLSWCNSTLWIAVPNEDGMGYHYIPDLAEDMPKKIDDLTWEFTIREEAKWSNGDPINADTYMYTFKTILDPKMVNAMAIFLADNNITIKNAYAYMLQGTADYPDAMDWEEVGIKKIDDRTIQITTETPVNEKDFCTHFTARSNYPVHPELFEECLSSDRLTTTYGSDLEHWIGCGPYTFDSWEYDNLHVYTKNEDHWLAEYFNYDEVQVRIVPEMNARVQLFESGQLDSLSPDSNTIEAYIDDPRMVSYPSTMVYDYDINVKNTSNPLSGNNNFEKAMYHAMNREVIARDIFGYMEPTGTYINGQAGCLSESGLTYRESKYGKEVWDMIESWSAEGEVCGYNPDLAYDYLMKAYADANLPEDYVLTVKVMHTEGGGTGGKLCEMLMAEWPTIFKGKVQVEPFVVASGMSLDMMELEPEAWDIVYMDWGRSLSRTLPYQVYYYHTKDYTARPTYTYTDRFEAQFAACEAVKTADYETILQETQKLEIIALEDVVSIPIVQAVNYELFADRLELPMKQYVPGFGWGSMFGDIVE
ncbi:MAG: ABC transporter substrate-binding protein [Clostridia bacterium]|nr:ABC transporter substrate-binding protein [Clostridia bacterium]